MVSRSMSPWWTVVAGAMGTSVGAGIVMLYTFGIFAKAFTNEFGWDRSVPSFCLTSFLIATGFGTVWLGSAINRWGVRWSAAAFIAVFAASLACVAALPPSAPLFYALFAVVGVSGAAATAMPYAVAVTGLFDGHRGLALGLVNTGAGFGAALAPHYATYLETQFGWRVGFLGVALIVGVVALFGLLFLVRDPPEIRGSVGALSGNTRSATRPTPWREFFRNRNFWLIAIGIVGVSVATFGVIGSLVPMLGDREITAPMIAAVLSTAGIASWFGRVIVGYAMDWIFAPYIAAFTFLLALFGVGLMALGGPGLPVLAGAALLGFTLGAEGDLVTYLVSRYFDIKDYSRVLGGMWVTWAWGGGIGTYLVGVTYRLTNSYSLSMVTFSLVLLVAAAGVVRLGPYAYAAKSESHSDRRTARNRTAA